MLSYSFQTFSPSLQTCSVKSAGGGGVLVFSDCEKTRIQSSLDIFNGNFCPARLSKRESVWVPARFSTAPFQNGSKCRSHPCPHRSHRSWDRNNLCFSSAVINKLPFVWGGWMRRGQQQQQRWRRARGSRGLSGIMKTHIHRLCAQFAH